MDNVIAHALFHELGKDLAPTLVHLYLPFTISDGVRTNRLKFYSNFSQFSEKCLSNKVESTFKDTTLKRI